MQANPYTAETPITIGGQECSLVFGWKALAQIYAECGPDAINNTFKKSTMWRQSPDTYAKMVHAGLKEKHADITLDQVFAGLPPFAIVVEILTTALLLAYFGSEGPQPSENSTDDDSKKN